MGFPCRSCSGGFSRGSPTQLPAGQLAAPAVLLQVPGSSACLGLLGCRWAGIQGRSCAWHSNALSRGRSQYPWRTWQHTIPRAAQASMPCFTRACGMKRRASRKMPGGLLSQAHKLSMQSCQEITWQLLPESIAK